MLVLTEAFVLGRFSPRELKMEVFFLVRQEQDIIACYSGRMPAVEPGGSCLDRLNKAKPQGWIWVGQSGCRKGYGLSLGMDKAEPMILEHPLS